MLIFFKFEHGFPYCVTYTSKLVYQKQMIQNSHYNLHLRNVSIVREDAGSCLILIGVLFGGFKFELI